MKGDDRPDGNLDSGMGTLQLRGTGLVLVSWLPDTIIDRGTMGVDASTPILWLNHRVRPRLFGYYLTPMPDAPPPTHRTQPGPDLVSQQQAVQSTDLRAIIARLQSEIHTLTMASPIPDSPATQIQPVRRRSVKFTNTEVPKFCEKTCWDQYRQVFDAIVKSNGLDDDAVAFIPCVRGCAECHSIGTRDTKSHAEWAGQCIKWPLLITGETSGLPT